MSRRNDISRIAMTAAGLGAALIGPSVSYSAQPGVAQAVEEVLVTARRREESLQEVPIAISAFGGDALEERGVQRIENMNAVAPNLSVMGGVNTGESQASFRVRGLPGVAVYIDGVNQATTDGLMTLTVTLAPPTKDSDSPPFAGPSGAVRVLSRRHGDRWPDPQPTCQCQWPGPRTAPVSRSPLVRASHLRVTGQGRQAPV